jgi:hypothetical protein
MNDQIMIVNETNKITITSADEAAINELFEKLSDA